MTRRRPDLIVRRRGTDGPSFLMTVPALVLFIGFAAIPLGLVAVLSLTSWDGLLSPSWAGLSNWWHLLGDPVTHRAVWISFQVTALSWLFQTPVCLLLGVFLAGRQRYRNVFAVLYFIPLLLSSAAIAIIWKNLLDPNFGLASASGLPFLNQNWLGDPKIALYTVIFVISWQFVPFHTLLYQAGVQQIPASLYEASNIDGVGRVQQFWYVTLPLLRDTIVLNSILMLVGSLTYFDVVFIMTGGGPGFATRMLPLDMYITGFQSNEMGLASATAVILVVVGLLIAVGLSRITGFGKMESQMEGGE